MRGSAEMTAKEELKKLISEMNAEQFRWFIDQMQLVLFGEAVEADRRKECQ